MSFRNIYLDFLKTPRKSGEHFRSLSLQMHEFLLVVVLIAIFSYLSLYLRLVATPYQESILTVLSTDPTMVETVSSIFALVINAPLLVLAISIFSSFCMIALQSFAFGFFSKDMTFKEGMPPVAIMEIFLAIFNLLVTIITILLIKMGLLFLLIPLSLTTFYLIYVRIFFVAGAFNFSTAWIAFAAYMAIFAGFFAIASIFSL